MKTVELKRSSEYGKRPHGIFPCAICGRHINEAKGKYAWIHMNTSNEVIPMDAEISPSEDMGCFPVGLDCLRGHPELKDLVEIN
jgi:hypothetical protein